MSRAHSHLGKRRPPWCERASIRQLYVTARFLRLHVDHIVPLSHPDVCGLHCWDNLAMISPKANSHKSNNWWPDSWHEQSDLVGGVGDPIQLEMNV